MALGQDPRGDYYRSGTLDDVTPFGVPLRPGINPADSDFLPIQQITGRGGTTVLVGSVPTGNLSVEQANLANELNADIFRRFSITYSVNQEPGIEYSRFALEAELPGVVSAFRLRNPGVSDEAISAGTESARSGLEQVARRGTPAPKIGGVLSPAALGSLITAAIVGVASAFQVALTPAVAGSSSVSGAGASTGSFLVNTPGGGSLTSFTPGIGPVTTIPLTQPVPFLVNTPGGGSLTSFTPGGSAEIIPLGATVPAAPSGSFIGPPKPTGIDAAVGQTKGLLRLAVAPVAGGVEALSAPIGVASGIAGIVDAFTGGIAQGINAITTSIGLGPTIPEPSTEISSPFTRSGGGASGSSGFLPSVQEASLLGGSLLWLPVLVIGVLLIGAVLKRRN